MTQSQEVQSWEEWRDELNRLYRAEYGWEAERLPTECTGEDCWREYFASGMTPREAIEEEDLWYA